MHCQKSTIGVKASYKRQQKQKTIALQQKKKFRANARKIKYSPHCPKCPCCKIRGRIDDHCPKDATNFPKRSD